MEKMISELFWLSLFTVFIVVLLLWRKASICCKKSRILMNARKEVFDLGDIMIDSPKTITEMPFDRLKIFHEVKEFSEQYKRMGVKFNIVPIVQYTSNGPQPNYNYKRFLVRIIVIGEQKTNFDLEVSFSRRWDSGDADIGDIKRQRDLMEATAYAQIVAAYLMVNVGVLNVAVDSHEVRLNSTPNIEIRMPMELREQKFYQTSFVDGETKF